MRFILVWFPPILLAKFPLQVLLLVNACYGLLIVLRVRQRYRFDFNIIFKISQRWQHGALTQIYVAVSPDILEKKVRGSYFVPVAKLVDPTKLAQDSSNWDSLYFLSEKLVKQVIEAESLQ